MTIAVVRVQIPLRVQNWFYQFKLESNLTILKNYNMKYTEEMIDQLIDVSDADGVWVMMQDLELQEESEYIERKYFNIG